MAEDKRSKEPSANLSRRRFVASAGVAAAAVGLSPSAGFPETASTSVEYDVIVIGGGFCGVTAARECRKAGYRTLLLEARNRLGGRTFTADFNGHPTDLGGTWVHWSQPHVWSEIRRSGLTLRETIGATADKLIVHTSQNDIVTLSSSKIYAEYERAMSAFMGDSRRLLPLPHDPFGSDEYKKVEGISCSERLASVKGIGAIYRDMIDGYNATSGHNYPDKIAWLEMVRWYSLPGHNLTDMGDSVSRYRFRDGTVSLINALMREGNPELRLGTPVRRVVQEGSSVTVQTIAGDEFHAKAVVSTVPLNVLKDIDWQPVLSDEKMQASKETHAGVGTKVHVLLEGDLGNVACVAPSHNALNFLFTEAVADGHTHVIGFGPSTDLLDVNDGEAVQAAVRRFIPDAKVVQNFGYQWTLDPYSKGTWCTLRPGMWSKYLRELQQPRGRLIFASADWANGWRGFIDGAIEQGLEAGRRVKELLS
jgi:monoamine oxidase